MKTKGLLIGVFTLFVLFVSEMVYLESQNSYKESKRLFVSLCTLPDLSISNEAHFVRHRSLSDTFSLFSNSPTLTEFFPSTFIYNYSPVQKNRISRIEIEK